MASRAGPRFSRPIVGRRFGTIRTSTVSPSVSMTAGRIFSLPAKITGSLSPIPRRGFGSADRRISAISWTCGMTLPSSVPPDIKIMSGRSARILSTFSWSLRPSLIASVSMMIAPAPRAARSADSADISRTTPATVICRPPPALDVDRYKSTPTVSDCEGVIGFPAESRICFPVRS